MSFYVVVPLQCPLDCKTVFYYPKTERGRKVERDLGVTDVQR